MQSTSFEWSHSLSFVSTINRWFCYNFSRCWKIIQSINYKLICMCEKWRWKMTWSLQLKEPYRPASCLYSETITETFLASTGWQSWKQEDVISREPIRRLTICLSANEAFLGSKQLNSFHFHKINWERICFNRNGCHVADSPISTTDLKRLYINTKSK